MRALAGSLTPLVLALLAVALAACTSLYRLENAVIRPLGEPRVHFALNCMVRGCPRLPREPFDPSRLDAQLERETRRFLNESRNVQVDPPLRLVRVNSILHFYREDFLAQVPSLVPYLNRYRAEPIPGDYPVRFFPYAWTLRQRRTWPACSRPSALP